MSVNRPELREISPSGYYDFDLFNEIGGNEELKTAVIHNADLRYEFYPAHGEVISLSVFYKHFINPIEWTFIDMGGSLRYLYENADKADNYGIEIEMRKKLGFMKMPSFTFMLNLAFIQSNVRFKPGEVLM
jgi:outer membrane receptor protein involved in Fe transport